ncbi:MAG: 5-formyltetrahydrofolate cyclo-ligase [Rhabdochlamydiaceae bacterium]|nr:5-formyltetrahydrofolate cyclo-ligase [Rhabdochlamydiaceae bacterium]
MSLKKELRLHWKKKLLQLSFERRQEGAKALTLYPLPEGIIASFVSFREEINMAPLNTLLAKKKSLALPVVQKDHLIFYHVTHLESELAPSKLGILEPIPSLCKIATHIDVILVPALVFDTKNHRLGYGKGYYDRWLEKGRAYSIGVGFKEQLIEQLPSDPHDIQLNQLCLV